jgi:hypothetical protein
MLLFLHIYEKEIERLLIYFFLTKKGKINFSSHKKKRIIQHNALRWVIIHLDFTISLRID